MSPHELLDDILGWFVESNNAKPYATVKEATVDFNERYSPNNRYVGHILVDIKKVVNKLQKDGYLEMIGLTLIQPIDTIYTVSLEGVLFHNEGGYTGRFNRQNAESIRLEYVENHRMENDNKMTSLTRVLAFGVFFSSLYYLVDIMTRVEDMKFLQAFASVLFVLFGMIAGVILCILLRKE